MTTRFFTNVVYFILFIIIAAFNVNSSAVAGVPPQSIAEEQQPVEKSAEDTSLDVEPVREIDADQEEIVFETPGQPTGLLPVRVVKIYSKTMFGGHYKFPYGPFLF